MALPRGRHPSILAADRQLTIGAIAESAALGHPSLLYYDAQCRLCVTLVRWLRRLDLLGSVQWRDSLDRAARRAGLDQAKLDRSAWLLTPAGTPYEGFHAFQRLALLLPPLWPLVPLLWLPGSARWGVGLYRWLADRRASLSGCPQYAPRQRGRTYLWRWPRKGGRSG